MPTIIKLNSTGDKIRLGPAGLPTCSCDCGDCCLYPADQLGGSYSESDLPDVIEFYGQTLTRDESNYVGGTYLGMDFEIQHAGTLWAWWSEYYGTSIGQSLCLIADYGADSVQDNFSDTYTLHSWYDLGEGRVDFETTLYRIGTCLWSGGDGPEGNDLYWDSAQCKWTLLEGMLKSGSQSSPVGDYGPSGSDTYIT
jgi:hypothetical protein